MPPPFAYRYRNEHSFDVARIKKLLHGCKGGGSLAAYRR